MTNTVVAHITNKITEITGNPDAAVFVGKIVTRQKTSSGIVYAIGNTGYVLSHDEYIMFEKAGAITRSAIPDAKEKVQAKKAPRQNATTQAARRKIEQITPISKKTRSAAPAEPIHETQGYGSEKQRNIIETSQFLKDWKATDFTIAEPEKTGISAFGERVTGIFDAIGKKSSDKMVKSMSK